MEIIPQIFTAKVMHKRLFPKVNKFVYSIYYLALPLSQIRNKFIAENLSINKFGILSFHEKDHGDQKGELQKWIKNILLDNSLNEITDEVILVAMPRVIGYVFNPISLWLCLDKERNLRAVLCEVNNTFGEAHNYLCYHKSGEIIKDNDWIEANKLFHVSPFLKREGFYKFRFSLKEDNLGIWINFYDQEGKQQLITSLIGSLSPLNKSSLRKVFLKHPLVTLKTIFLIHWQALKLVSKGIRYISKPKQLNDKITKPKKH